MPARRDESGFTLVELLVVIAIIGILIALLLPAVQAARESARRSQCQNNLKQIGLAVHLYHDTFKRMPINISGIAGDGTPPMPRGAATGKSWLVSILPQLEQQPLFDQFVLEGFFGDNLGIRHPDNRELIKTRPQAFVCPSAPSRFATTTQAFQLGGVEVATTNYLGVMGESHMVTPSTFGGSAYCNAGHASYGQCSGIFWRTDSLWEVSMRNISDGTSHTYLVGEDLPEYNRHNAWPYSNAATSSTYAPPNYKPFPAEDFATSAWFDLRGFRSEHPGGVQFCLADGSVQFVNQSIPIDLYRAFSTKSGDEVTYTR